MATFEDEDGEGVVEGKHNVVVIKTENKPGTEPPDGIENDYSDPRPSAVIHLVPRSYGDLNTTPLRATVERGKENHFVFKLRSNYRSRSPR